MRQRASGRHSPAAALLAAALAFAVLWTTVAGHAGVHVVDGALAAHLFALHLHGIPGEAAYVDHYRAPAPFVHDHCHEAPSASPPLATPAEVHAAGSLAGTALCAAITTLPSAVTRLSPIVGHLFAAPEDVILTPLAPPPQG